MYTAKARMLSFNFLNDDVVYRMPPMQALLLAGMVVRADNLGRLPGSPAVLLPYLFFPKEPRRDASASELGELLSVLASNDPPVITWYEVDGMQYVEFTHWTKHQAGLRAHNKKSSFPGPDSPGVKFFKPKSESAPTLDLDGGPAERPPDVPEQPHRSVRELLGRAAESMGMSAALKDFEPEQVKRWCTDNLDYRIEGGVQKFAQWLWSTGMKSMPHVIECLTVCASYKVENPYAYFAVNTEHRASIMGRVAGDVAEREGVRHKEQERSWLEGQGR